MTKLSKGTISTGMENYTYTYNAFGQRIAKNYTYVRSLAGDQATVSGVLTNAIKQYFYDHSGRLIAESGGKTYQGEGTTTENIVYLYDESGMIGMERTVGGVKNTYYFHRNLLGDVVGIYDTTGTRVVRYNYDAWGNCTIASGTTNTSLAKANPIRYRGYYYDDDTGLYYLNARYYSPKWRRFISPATSTINPDVVNGLNVYVYAGNNPINVTYRSSDTNGTPSGITSSVGAAGLTYRKRTYSNFHATYRNLPVVPEWLDTLSTAADHAFSLINPIRTAAATLMYTNLWDVMRLDGVTELPGTLSQVATGVGWGLGVVGGVITGYKKLASGASVSSSIAGGIINAGINIGGMYAASAIASWGMGLLAAGTALPGGAIILIGAAASILIGIAIEHLLTKRTINGDTIEGHINNIVDWLIFWD